MYVEREAVRLAIFNTLWRDRQDVDIAYDMAKSVPAADVAPVVHGYWSKVGGDLHSSGYPVACSRCHKYVFVHYKGSLGSLDGHNELFEEPVLCPHCGANMK